MPEDKEDTKRVEDVEKLVSEAKKAFDTYKTFTQEQVDHIFHLVANRVAEQRIPLAQSAVEETGMGIVEDKAIKNLYAAEMVFNKYKSKRTCGVIEENYAHGYVRIVEPVGVIAGVVPTTNPTSTAIFKTLISIKTRNAIVFAPHPRAKKCTAEAVKIMHDAIVEAGGPKGLVSCIEEPSVVGTQTLMGHKNISLILATGGPGMVKAAYSSGTPALGVGAGNTPVLIDDSADIPMAVNSVLLSKSFDNGVICASEQCVLVSEKIYDKVLKELSSRGAHIANEAEVNKLRTLLFPEGKLNAKIVGQKAATIAKMIGTVVPDETKALVAEIKSAQEAEFLSHEKLSPVLALIKVKDFKDGLKKSETLVHHGGHGHTSVIFCDEHEKEKIDMFSALMETGRVVVNTPASFGAIGDLFNFYLAPSMTLGCGSWGGNAVSENVGIEHLLNTKVVAKRRENMQWFRVPPRIFFKTGSLGYAFEEYKDRKRAFIVTDKPLLQLGVVDKVAKELDKYGIVHQVFSDVRPDPTLSDVRALVKELEAFQPDLLVAVGGGSPMDATKVAWLLYEQPDTVFADIAQTFLDIRKRINVLPALGKKAHMIAIPTTSGTGSEVTPFSVITDDATGIKYPIADYALSPSMAIVDADLVMTMPKSLCAASGLDAMTHALEAYVSIMENEYANSHAKQALEMIFQYLPDSYNGGDNFLVAREKIHNAATIAGMAFANSFLGVCHSMAHKLGAAFHIPHGFANSLMISHVVLFNASTNPTKQAAFSHYTYPYAQGRYAEIATLLGCKGKTDGEKVLALVEKIEALKASVNCPTSIAGFDIKEKDFMAKVDEMSEMAFNDQCTGANPRYPLIKEIREMYIDAYHGKLDLSLEKLTR